MGFGRTQHFNIKKHDGVAITRVIRFTVKKKRRTDCLEKVIRIYF